MFENATVLHLKRGTAREALAVLREQIVPVLKQQAGLQGLALLPNDGADQITIISLWTSEAHARVVEAQCAYRRQMAKLDPYLGAQPIGDVGGIGKHSRHPISLN